MGRGKGGGMQVFGGGQTVLQQDVGAQKAGRGWASRQYVVFPLLPVAGEDLTGSAAPLCVCVSVGSI